MLVKNYFVIVNSSDHIRIFYGINFYSKPYFCIAIDSHFMATHPFGTDTLAMADWDTL
jgi:hypothetical protein